MLNMDFNIYFTWYHTSPNVNAISYFVGIAFGFLMMKKTSFTQLQQKIFWILSVLSIIIMYLWQYSLFKTGDKENNLSALLWHSIGKLLFSSSFGWIYYEICSGRAGYY